ncbi:MAG: hypothetical protein OXM61_10640 [Candidatus Poribacteria bacterium]|nr:hypothetical protein [Candidatus Poribacteria bacterium]
MKKNIQITRLGLSILLILTTFSVNAETAKTTTSQVTYNYYTLFNFLEAYQGFLPSPAPEGLHYHGRMRATANIDDTPQKENIVLIVGNTEPRTFSGDPTEVDNWILAFLIIAERKAGKLERKALFKLFDTGRVPLDVSTKSIELHNAPLVFTEPTDVSFRLVDVTDDGTLDVWVESAHGVAFISFQEGAFKEVFSNYTVSREKLTDAFDVEYVRYDWPYDLGGQKYHRFLGNPPSEKRSYTTRLKAIANIDDTPEKETIVLMVAEPSGEWVEVGQWNKAFLLITEAETEITGFPKTKELFGLFGGSSHDLNVPGKTIEVQSAPFVFRGASGGDFQGVSFELVDLTGDGILDVWVDHAYGVAVISFQEGEFKEVCSAYSSHKREDPIEYVDIDKDGIYEIKIPDRISIDGPTAAYLEWMSFYEWDGNTYILNNERFYAENDAFLRRLLDQYETWARYSRNEVYHFYIGLVYAYRGNAPMAREFLQRVVEQGKKQDYIQAAEELLKNLPPH